MSRFAAVFASLTALLLVAIGGAVIGATVEIQSIVYTGPIFSLIGIGLCVTWCFHRRGLCVLLVALSLPVLSLSVFWLIYSRSWGPGEAAQPVSAILLVYQVASVVVGLIAIREQMTLGTSPTKAGVQFSIKSLLALTGIVAIALGAVRLALDQGAHASLGLAIGFTVLTPFAIFAVFVYPMRLLKEELIEAAAAIDKKNLADPSVKG